MNVKHVDRRASKTMDDPYPPEGFVKWHRWLTVGDLQPGQWSISPDGEVFKRLGEKKIYETRGSVIC